MNIWVIHHHADPPDGHWTYTYVLMEAMARLNHRATIFSSSFSHYSRTDNRLSRKQIYREQAYGNVKFVFVKTPPYLKNDWRRLMNMAVYSWRTYRFARRLDERPDIIIGAWPPPFGSWIAQRLAQQKGAAFLYEVHDLWPVFLIESGIIKNRSLIASLLRRMQWSGLSKSSGILALWPRMHLYFEGLGIPSSKTTWMPMGIDFSSIKIPLPKGEKRADEPFIVMYRGRFGNTNNIGTMISCARICQQRSLTQIKFVFVGDGPERRRFEEMAKGHGNVSFESFVAHDKIMEDIVRADVLMASLPDLPHFGKYGMISTKLLEYLAANRPLIFATNDGEHAVKESGAGIIVPPQDPSALADAVAAMYAMTPQERGAIGTQGVEYLRRYHDITMLAQRLEKVMIGVVSREKS